MVKVTQTTKTTQTAQMTQKQNPVPPEAMAYHWVFLLGIFYWENYILLRYKVSQLSDTLAKFLNVKLVWNQVEYKMSFSSHILPIPHTYKKEGEKASLLTTKSQYSMQNVN